ncbi:hypothetical protein N7G274_003150 [Stereocaulon virgatum]|uniref:Uncharacterized protein n=1 Tax=Stereocaulon virgatum TaxID=373712 RepID=A0ABR4AH02_9LECA
MSGSMKIPIALSPISCADLVSFILQHHEAPTTLISCSPREAFLAELQASIQPAALQNASESVSASQDDDLVSTSLHPFLLPTIHLIARSRSINLVFVPTLPHLRAYLATYAMSLTSTKHTSTAIRAGSQIPILGIWGLARLHRSTAEHSAQGLSRTVAAIVDAASLANQQLVLAEPSRVSDIDHYGDAEASDETPAMSEDAWKEHVPLLSGSVRFGGEDRHWAGKTVEVGHVIAKWCRFVKLDDEAMGA